MLEFISFGYYTPLAVGLFVGGMPALVAAMFLVVSGKLSFFVLLTASLITTLIWDAIWYAIGYFVPIQKIENSRLFRNKEALYKRYYEQYDNHKYKFLFMSRFVFGMNSIFSIISGIYSMRFWIFMFLSGLSIVVWNYIVRGLSILIHSNINRLGLSDNIVLYIPIFILIMLAALYILKKIFYRTVSKD